jgi:hypothetical protein
MWFGRDPVELRDGQVDDHRQDGEKEGRARYGRTQAEAADVARLGKVVADRRAERTGQDVGGPEGQDRVQPELPVRDTHDSDQCAEDERRLPVPDPELLSRIGFET